MSDSTPKTIKRFRKKPLIVTAEQYFPAVGCVPLCVWNNSDGIPWVNTLEGPVRVREGDWIVTGVKGERYPVKPDIFAATYEAVEGVD